MPADYDYGISVTVTNLASAEIAKINKQLEGLGKQVTKNAKTVAKGAKEQEKSTQKLAVDTKGQIKASQYLNNLLKRDQVIYKQTNKLISDQGGLAKINAEIRKNGYAYVSKGQQKQLAGTVKQIEYDRKHGVEMHGWMKSNEEDILRLNTAYKKHGSAVRKVWTGVTDSMSKVNKGIHKVGMGFLTLIGPIFLVGAAMRMVQQVTDALVNPFLKFEDGLYELRKTADLTKQEMLAMGDAIDLMAQRIPIARTELVEIAATAGRLGIQGREDILNFTEVIAMMATATVLSADESANALARVSNAFQLPIANVEYLGSIINELSNTTASNSREIVKSIENVGASGKMMGISIDAVAAMSATLISAGMSSERSGCLDDETEVLTKVGWKGIDEISEDDFIATRTPKGYLEYRKPKLIYRRNWNGDMVHLKTSRADILVTPDHRMLITTQYTNYEKKVEAKTLLTRGTFKIPRTCKWQGDIKDTFVMASSEYLNNQGEAHTIIDERTVDMMEWCRFMGYFLSEGSITRRGNDYGAVELSQLDGQTKEKMWKNVESLGFVPHNHKNKGVSIYNKQLYKTLEEYVGVKAPFKYVPQYIKDLDVPYLNIFLDAFIDGDGSRSKDGTQKIYTTSKQLLNDLWEVSLKCGYHVSDASRHCGFKNSELFTLYLGKQKHATFVNRRGNVKSEHYEGRIWCPVLPPYETIMIKRNGKVAWTYQTRLRRFYTELARNSDKAAEAMKISSEKMKMDIEEDPTKAIMDYLKHLREIPNRVDKIVEAQEIFGKVGGFAVATLAENYVELEQNMENARTELAFGTSLQREFEIAISKSSAQLQIMDNRIESATAGLGEHFIPTIKSGKGVIAAFYEGLLDVADAMDEIYSKGNDAETSIDALYEEMARLRIEATKGEGFFEQRARAAAEFDILISSAEGSGKNWIQLYTMAREMRIKEEEASKSGIGFDTGDMMKSYEAENAIMERTEGVYGKRIKQLKETNYFQSEQGAILQTVEDLNIQMFDIEKNLNAVRKEGNDRVEDRIALEVYREDVYRQGLKTVRDELAAKKAAGLATKEEMGNLKDLNSILEGVTIKGVKYASMLSREAATTRLVTKAVELENKTLRDQDAFYASLTAAVGDKADALLVVEDLQGELNKRGYEAVILNGELKVVYKELADSLYDMELPLKEIANLTEDIGKAGETLVEYRERMEAMHKETSNLYYAIGNVSQVIGDMGETFADSSRDAEYYVNIMQDLVDADFELIVTERGIEAVEKSALKTRKKLGTETIRVTDAIEEMNELGQDSIIIWGQLTITQSEYEERLKSIWGLTSSYISTLRRLGDAQTEFNDASREMPTRIKELWRPYKQAFVEVERLVTKNEDYEAGIKLQAIAADIAADRDKAHSRRKRDDLGRILDYLDLYTQKTGLIPDEYAAIEDEVALLKDLMFEISEGEIILTADLNTSPFDDQMQRLLDADYITSVKIEMNLEEVEKQLSEAAAVIPVPLEKAVQKVKEEPEETFAPYIAPRDEEKYIPPKEITSIIPIQVATPTDIEKGAGIERDFPTSGTMDMSYLDANTEAVKKNTEQQEDLTFWDKAADVIGNAFSGVVGMLKIPGMAKGGPIDRTGLYNLHEGEHVLSAPQTDNFKDFVSRSIKSMQSGGRIYQTGEYQLHEGEHVLTKQQTKNIDSHNLDVHMGGVTLNDDYNVKRLLRDIQEMEMSAI